MSTSINLDDLLDLPSDVILTVSSSEKKKPLLLVAKDSKEHKKAITDGYTDAYLLTSYREGEIPIVLQRTAEPTHVIVLTEDQYRWVVQQGRFEAMVKLQLGINREHHSKTTIESCVRKGWIQKLGSPQHVELSVIQADLLESGQYIPGYQPLRLPSKVVFMNNKSPQSLYDVTKGLYKEWDPAFFETVIRILTFSGVQATPKHTHTSRDIYDVYFRPLFVKQWLRNLGEQKKVPLEPLDGVLFPDAVACVSSNLKACIHEKTVPPMPPFAVPSPITISSSSLPKAQSKAQAPVPAPRAPVPAPGATPVKKIKVRPLTRAPAVAAAATAPAAPAAPVDPGLFAKFGKDIQKDSFILQILTAEQTFLKMKKDRYASLLKLDWTIQDGAGQDQEKLINVLTENKKKVEARLRVLVTPSEKVKKEKQAALKKLYDDLGSIKQVSRIPVKSEVLRLIYTFITYPTFYLTQFMNYAILGPAGSGKTKLATSMASAFYALGINLTDKVKYATPQELIGSYIGQTAGKTRALLIHQLEGVLFIDEAYGLANCDSEGNLKKDQHYGGDAIIELINFVDKFKGCIVIIVAGYSHMIRNCLMRANEGMPRRFNKYLELPSFSADELTDILFDMIRSGTQLKHKQMFTPEQTATFRKIIQDTESYFTNGAGDIENLTQWIVEDYVVCGKSDYTPVKIFETFQKFFAQKGFEMYY